MFNKYLPDSFNSCFCELQNSLNFLVIARTASTRDIMRLSLFSAMPCSTKEVVRPKVGGARSAACNSRRGWRSKEAPGRH